MAKPGEPIPSFGFDVASSVSASTGEPIVEIRANGEAGGQPVSVTLLLIPPDAEEAALSILAAAGASRSDAAFVRAARARGYSEAQLGFILRDVRAIRDGAPPKGRD